MPPLNLRNDHWPHSCGYGKLIRSLAVTVCPWATSTIRIECTSLRRCDQEPRAHCRHPPAKQIVPCQIGVHGLVVYSRSNIKSRLEQEWNSPCLLLVLLISHDCNARQSACGVVSCVSAQWPIHPHQEIRCTPKGYRDTDCLRVWLMFSFAYCLTAV